MPISMPELKYPKNALQPFISEQTLEYHYGKHHKAYVDKTNEQIKDTKLDQASLKDIVIQSSGGLFNASAQAWNHEFYWNSLRPSNQKKTIPSNIQSAIEKQFQSIENFQQSFTKEAISHFGSGWAWLTRNKEGQLNILSTHDADTPLLKGETPLLTCDVWEHAYYLDYQNNRGKYLESFWALVNWEFADQNYSS